MYFETKASVSYLSCIYLVSNCSLQGKYHRNLRWSVFWFKKQMKDKIFFTNRRVVADEDKDCFLKSLQLLCWTNNFIFRNTYCRILYGMPKYFIILPRTFKSASFLKYSAIKLAYFLHIVWESVEIWQIRTLHATISLTKYC